MSGRMQQCLLLIVIAVALLQPCYARRSLKQDALSNSNGCLATIPKCEVGACATRDVMGTARWVCLRCSGNYEPVVDASGQDNIIQCVCPKGTYQADPAAPSCARCEPNQYCPGGEKAENPTNFGASITCGTGLVTRSSGARSLSDCVAPAGYALSSPGSPASQCTKSTYAPQFNRLARCLRCQSGLEENPSANFYDTATNVRDTKRRVCKVPPGRYMSQGLVRVCPQGFYRTTYENYDAAAAQVCTACNPGITTSGAGSTSGANCSIVIAGYGVGTVTTYNTPASLPNPTLPVPDPTTGLPTATLCDLGFYAKNGNCVRCPYNTVTTAKGAKSVEECVVPPGYFIGTNGLALCTQGTPATSSAAAVWGTFREGWVMYSDTKAMSCTPCGDGILSEPRDINENPMKAATDVKVQATSASCFILAGQGMIATGQNLFTGKDCPVNTYGASDTVYGWAAAPCKPCPRNMITDAAKQSSMDACINPDKFGYQSEGASKCAPGFYAARGSKKPCQQCPPGRTTLPTATDPLSPGVSITDCMVKPGLGVVDGTATDPWNPTTSTLNDTQKAGLSVLECPAGYFGAGGALDSKCAACGTGASTEITGATSVDNCTVCIAGYGQNGQATCTPCAFGWFNPGGAKDCMKCDDTTFYPPVDSKDTSSGPAYLSEGTTLYTGSISAEACVPKASQMSPEAGQAFFASATTTVITRSSVATADTLPACIAACATTANCIVQFNASAASGSRCVVSTLTPATSDAPTGTTAQFVYKLPPAGLVAASSVPKVAGKMMSSGHYAHGTIANAGLAEWLTVGTGLTADARTFSSSTTPVSMVAPVKDCKKACDNSNVCIGFVATPATAAPGSATCYFRGGVDALGTRAFFAIPAGSTATLAW